MNTTLRLLRVVQPQTVREQRHKNGTWAKIHPPTLLLKYHDPELALAAAIIQLTADDIRRPNHRTECFSFLRSDWFSLIARGLEFHPETLNALDMAG